MRQPQEEFIEDVPKRVEQPPPGVKSEEIPADSKFESSNAEEDQGGMWSI